MTNEPPPANITHRFQQCIQLTVPVAGLIACVCGVLLVLGVLTAGALSLFYVFIPCAVIGGVATLWVILGAAIGNCYGSEQQDDGTGRPAPRIRTRPSAVAVQRRVDILQHMQHIESVAENSDGRTCSICLSESPPQRVLLNCGHMFHEDCIKEWMTRARFARCPLCRSGLNTPGLQQPAGDVSDRNEISVDGTLPV